MINLYIKNIELESNKNKEKMSFIFYFFFQIKKCIVDPLDMSISKTQHIKFHNNVVLKLNR